MKNNEKDFFRNQIADLVKERDELLSALKSSNKLIQECVDYYESTGKIDKVSDHVIKQSLANQTIISKYKPL